jgi:hypothetical protein
MACRVAGTVANRWPVLSRDNRQSFHHPRAVAALPNEQARALLEVAANQGLTVEELRSLAKRDRREQCDEGLGPAQTEALPTGGRFGVHADNHYPTMTLADIVGTQKAVDALWSGMIFCRNACCRMSGAGVRGAQ